MVEALKVNGAKIKYREGKGSLSCIGRGKINLTVTIFYLAHRCLSWSVVSPPRSLITKLSYDAEPEWVMKHLDKSLY